MITHRTATASALVALIALAGSATAEAATKKSLRGKIAGELSGSSSSTYKTRKLSGYSKFSNWQKYVLYDASGSGGGACEVWKHKFRATGEIGMIQKYYECRY